MRQTLLVTMLLTLAACTASSPAIGTAADEQAIRDGGAKWSAAWNKGDAKAMAAMVTDDYESIDASGVHTQGRPAFEQAMAAQFAGRPAGMTMTITTGFVKWLSATSAVAGGGWSVAGPTAEMSARGSWISAYQKQDGAWLIASGLGANEPPGMPMVSDTAHAPS